MEQIFRVIVSLSISGSLIGLLLLLFRPIAKRFFAKRWTYYLWMLVLVRLLVPIHTDLNLMERLSVVWEKAENRQVSAEEVSEVESAESAALEKQAETVSGIESAENADETSDTAVTGNAGSKETAVRAYVGSQAADRRAGILQTAGILWILGVFFTAVYRVFTYRNFVKRINAGRIPVTDQRVLNKSLEIQTRLEIVKGIPLYENAVINTPMLIGLRKPHIVLPSELLAETVGRENDIYLILHHELVHYKRKDIWYKWLFQAVLCVHWFNPFLYFFNRMFNVDCELSCDEMVMTILSDAGRRIYGNVLLDVAEKNLPGETFVMHRNVPTMTLLEEKSTLKERLQEIAKYQKKGLVIGFCSALVLMAFVAAAVVCGVAGFRADSGEVFVTSNDSPGSVGRVSKSIPDISDMSISVPDISFEESTAVDEKGKPYRMYDDNELIAGESEHDIWQAGNYYGGGNSINIDRLRMNGSDELWIVYANKETTWEVTSTFKLQDGRFKIVQVMPDQTVQVLNEDGKEISAEITLYEGRNCFKMVGQDARVKDMRVAYSGENKKEIEGIYRSVNEEYAHRLQAGLEPLDMARLDEVSMYLDAKDVSELYRSAWESGIEFSNENWKNLFVFSDGELTSRYLLEALQDGKISGFDSRIVIEIAPYMSGENLKNIVLTLGKDALTFQDLHDIIPFLGNEGTAQCLSHYIDLGNVLTDSQLRDIQAFVSEEDFYRIIEHNGKKK